MNSLCLLLLLTIGQEPTLSHADRSIVAAIAGLEKARAATEDPAEQAKIDAAVRELETIIEGKPDIDLEITPALLKAKFAGKAVYNPKNGELTLTYDFPGKGQLADFETKDSKAIIAKKHVVLEAADNLKHRAKWKRFTVTATMSHKGMRGVGIASTNGSHLGTGGANPDTLYLGVAGGPTVSKVVPANIRSGNVPVSLSVTPARTTVRYGTETLAQPTLKANDTHQVELLAGAEGCAFTNLVISGTPDPQWLKHFLEAE